MRHPPQRGPGRPGTHCAVECVECSAESRREDVAGIRACYKADMSGIGSQSGSSVVMRASGFVVGRRLRFLPDLGEASRPRGQKCSAPVLRTLGRHRCHVTPCAVRDGDGEPYTRATVTFIPTSSGLGVTPMLMRNEYDPRPSNIDLTNCAGVISML